MIDTACFAKHWKLVDHSLVNTWTWEHVLFIMQQQFLENPQQVRDLGNDGFTIGGLDRDAGCKTVLDYLQPLAVDHHARASLYVGLNNHSRSFPPHNDPGQHVWIWQILGNTPWLVAGNNFVLHQGEMFYITPGTEHAAQPTEPRASISFSLEQFD